MSPELRRYLIKHAIKAQIDAARYHRQYVSHMRQSTTHRYESWQRTEIALAEDNQRWAAEAHARAAMFMSGLIR